MNISDISTQLLYTTVPIISKKKNGDISTGTGFIFSVKEDINNSIPLLITNYHVLENSEMGFVEFHIANNGKPTDEVIRIQFDDKITEMKQLGNLDLIAIPLATTLNNLNEKGIQIFYRTVDQDIIPTSEQIDDLAALENIVFIGYPNGIYDQVNKSPIARQGITATPIWNAFGGEEAFLIDAGVFPGSSGSPVFIFNQGSYPTKNGITIGSRLFFVGVIVSTYKKEPSYLSLGKAINSKIMYNEIEAFIERLKKENM